MEILLATAARPPTGSRAGAARLAGFVWRLVAPYFEQQQAFNSALVDHVNRNVAAHRGDASADRVVDSTSCATSCRSSPLRVAPHRLPPADYARTSTRRTTSSTASPGGCHEDNREFDRPARSPVGRRSAAAISGVGDELAKRWESMVAREQRYDARVASLAAAHDELRGRLAIVQQAGSVLKREIERPDRAGRRLGGAPRPAGVAGRHAGTRAQPAAALATQLAGAGDSSTPTSTWASRTASAAARRTSGHGSSEYLPFFEGASDVLDVGCGRGEFLDLLTSPASRACGLDLNREMVEVCRARGLQVAEGDALGYLHGLPDGSLGGLLAAQVVEHLQPDYLLALLDAAYHKLRPGSRRSSSRPSTRPAGSRSSRATSATSRTCGRCTPTRSATSSRRAGSSGSPFATARRIRNTRSCSRSRGDDESSQTLNANVEKLNRLMFTYIDYAVIGERL